MYNCDGFENTCGYELIFADNLPQTGELLKLYIIGTNAYKYATVGGSPIQVFANGTYTETMKLSNTVWVNLDLAINDLANRVFKTVADAQTWITANGGTLSTTNTWTIKLPSGLITESLVKLPFIEFEVSAGTIIDELTSGVAYSTNADLSKARINNLQINTLTIPSGMCMTLLGCISNSIIIEDDTARLFVSGSYCTTLDLGNSECEFDNSMILGVITNYNDTEFVRCVIKSSVTIASGETLELVDSVCDSITNNGTLNNYQHTYDSDLVADATTKGCRRYTETANSSSFEMVMKTGASTYEWVKIKENTW